MSPNLISVVARTDYPEAYTGKRIPVLYGELLNISTVVGQQFGMWPEQCLHWNVERL